MAAVVVVIVVVTGGDDDDADQPVTQESTSVEVDNGAEQDSEVEEKPSEDGG